MMTVIRYRSSRDIPPPSAKATSAHSFTHCRSPAMLVGAAVCLVHAIVPSLFERAEAGSSRATMTGCWRTACADNSLWQIAARPLPMSQATIAAIPQG